MKSKKARFKGIRSGRSVARIRVINIRKIRFAPEPRHLKNLIRKPEGSNRSGPALDCTESGSKVQLCDAASHELTAYKGATYEESFKMDLQHRRHAIVQFLCSADQWYITVCLL